MSESPKAYFFRNSMLLRLRKLTNEKSGALVTVGVTVTAVLVERNAESPIGGTSITLTHDGNGTWSGVYPSDVAVTPGQAIDALVTIDGGSVTTRGRIRVHCQVREREVG